MSRVAPEDFRPIVPQPRHAYYIVAPQYVRTSAGVKALHLLCHALNRTGERAYMVARPFLPHVSSTHPDLLTPLLTPELVAADHARGLTPITVYPETIAGNPLRAPLVVRYVLNFAGLLGGTQAFDAAEIRFGYSSVLAESVGVPANVLFIPASDTATFQPEPKVDRRGTCFFADKYQSLHGGKLLPITQDSVEITRDRADSPTPAQIAELFRRSELFYCYENSALAIEAVLCECPVVFLPNEHLTDIIALRELGRDGYAWGSGPEDIARAKATVAEGRRNYLRTFDLFWSQLERFVRVTQERARVTPYEHPMNVKHLNSSNAFQDLLRLARSAITVFRRHGLAGVATKTRKRFGRLLSGTKMPTQARW